MHEQMVESIRRRSRRIPKNIAHLQVTIHRRQHHHHNVYGVARELRITIIFDFHKPNKSAEAGEGVVGVEGWRPGLILAIEAELAEEQTRQMPRAILSISLHKIWIGILSKIMTN